MSFLDNVLRKMKLSDNRKAPRLDSPMLVAYYWDGAAPTAHEIQNISYDGFYLLTDDRLRPGTVVTMTLQRTSNANEDSTAQPHLTVISIVVRQGPDGIGFAFVPQEPKDAERSQNVQNKPADKRTIRKFIEQVHSDGFLTMIQYKCGIPKQPLSRPIADTAKPKGKPMRKFADESGQALVISALAMTCLLGFAALAADVGIMMREKRMAQTAADAAAVAGALELNFLGSGSTAAIQAAGLTAAGENGFSATTSGTITSSGVTVTINAPPKFGPNQKAGYVEAIVSIQQPTIFMGLFGMLNVTPTARAVATSGGGASYGCVYVLAPTGAGAMSLQGSFTVTAPNCGVIIDSSDPDALQFTGAGGTLTAGSVGVVGGCGGKCSDSTPLPVQNIVPQSDPLVGQEPVPTYNAGSCTAIPSTSTIAPGCYTIPSGGATLSNVVMSAGTYIFTGTGTLGFSGTVTGTGVTLYLSPTVGNSSGGKKGSPGTALDASNGTLNLVAPQNTSTTTYTYNGVVLFVDPSNPNTILFDKGNASGTLNGIIYAPGSQLALHDSGGDKNGGLQLITDLIVNSLNDQTATLGIQSYSQANPGTTPLSKIALVE